MRPNGFTLPEALIAAAVLAFAVAAIAQAIAAGHAQTDAALHDLRALSLAEAMLEEALSKPYVDPDGVDVEAARSEFDDLDDFDGFAEPAGSLEDAVGQAYTGLFQRFARRIEVSTETLAAGGFGAVAGKTVTVTVDDGGRDWTLSRFVPEPVAP